MTPDRSILPAVRTELEQAERHMRAAVNLLQENGWPENAAELRRTIGPVRIWTALPHGWIDILQHGSPYVKAPLE